MPGAWQGSLLSNTAWSIWVTLWMDLCYQSCLSGKPVGLCLSVCPTPPSYIKNIFIQYAQTFQPNSPIPAMQKGTIDFYHVIPLSVVLTLAGDHGVSGKQNPLASFSRTFLTWMAWDLVLWWSNSSWASLDYFLGWFNKSREITASLLTASNCNVGIHLEVYEQFGSHMVWW